MAKVPRQVDKAPHLAAVVLAAGSSRRFGPGNKLLADADGVPLVRRVVARALVSRAGRVVVVTGHERDAVEAALAGLDLVLVHNPRHLLGMGTSVAAGIGALGAEVSGALVVPGDMPELDTGLINRLLAVFEASGAERIVFPATPRGEQRNPVVWPRRFFADLMRLGADKGGRDLIKAHGNANLPIEMADGDIFLDIDRPEDLERWQRLRKPKA
jgi:molybdenum cofactor cytidylyltransferase